MTDGGTSDPRSKKEINEAHEPYHAGTDNAHADLDSKCASRLGPFPHALTSAQGPALAREPPRARVEAPGRGRGRPRDCLATWTTCKLPARFATEAALTSSETAKMPNKSRKRIVVFGCALDVEYRLV